jgi:hypothetical protein
MITTFNASRCNTSSSPNTTSSNLNFCSFATVNALELLLQRFQNAVSLSYTKGLLILFSFAFYLNSAKAQLAPVTPPTGGFAIDGGLRANTPTASPFAADQGDWYPGTGGTGTSVFNESGVPIAPSTALTSGKANPTDAFNGGDDIFSNGSKFNDYISSLRWTTNSAPDKNDINNVLYHIARDPSNNNQWAFMAGDRLSTNGTSYIDFEFLQGTVSKNLDGSGTFSSTPAAGKTSGGGRTENDMLISMEYTNGGTKPLVYVYQWKLSGNTWSYQLATIANLSSNAFAETNRTGQETGLPYTAFGNTYYEQYAFVEAAVNITFLLEQTGLACGGLSIKTLWVKTKAAATSTAALKDFVDPIPVSLTFGSSSVDARGPYCVSNNNAIQLGATPLNGVFTGTGVTNSGSTYYFTPFNAGTGTHRINYSASGCSSYIDIVVNALPTLGGPAAVCAGSTINLTPASGGTWSSSDNSKATITNGGVVSGIAAGSVTFTFTDGNTCSATKNVTVNALPTLGGPAAVCAGSTINLTPASGGTWSSSDNSKATITNGGVVSALAAGSVTFTFTDGNTCSATKNVTVNAQPLAPTLIIVQPSLCGTVSTGSISVCSPNANYTYSISLNGGAFGSPQSGSASPVFNNLAAGTNPVVKVVNTGNSSCFATANCTDALLVCPNPANASRMRTDNSQPTVQQIVVEDQAKVTAFPNPFNDRIKFVVTSSIAGKGSLAVFNMLGQKVKSVYQGQFVAGNQNFELTLPSSQRTNLIYVLTVGDKRITGKLLHLNR